ncbi:MAG: transcription factor S [Promethearchaeota archaeon]
MEFCNECGSMMLPTKLEGKRMFKCKCGASKPLTEEKSEAYRLNTKIKHPIRNEVTNVSEVINWKEKHLKSTIKDFKCRSCGYNKATLETRQTRSADEGMTHFIICLKCGRHRKIGS